MILQFYNLTGSSYFRKFRNKTMSIGGTNVKPDVIERPVEVRQMSRHELNTQGDGLHKTDLASTG